MHVAKEAPTEGPKPNTANQKNPESVFLDRKLAHLRGTSDTWTDFFVLSRAVALIASSSGFGLVAAQIGAVPYVYTPDSCVRIDLL